MNWLDEDNRQLAAIVKSFLVLVGALVVATSLQTHTSPPPFVIESLSNTSSFEALESLSADSIAIPEYVTILEPKAVSAPSVKPKGDKYRWMQQAGIPESDWQWVDEIITRESTWRHTAWNSQGSGAYGLCQSLPASKMASAGADYMTNPITQLKWCHQYAQEYGGWYQAAQYSRCVGRCFSTKVNRYVQKDHKWW